MQTDRLKLDLVPHPAHPPAAVRSVGAKVRTDAGGWLLLRWRVEDSAGLLVPRFAGNGRADGLWRATCFELFCRRPGEEAYVELNLSPSEQWAAYDFSAYRAGMAERTIARAPVITPRPGRATLLFDAALRLGDLPSPPWEFGLSAVIEEGGGAKSYWALAHPPGAADFHHPACFAARLAPRALR